MSGRTRLIGAAITAWALIGAAPVGQPQPLSIALEGMRSDKGQMLVCVTRSAQYFPDCTKDPDKHHFDKVIEAALVVKEVLDAIDVPSFPKTSGSTGIHIYIPMGGKYDYDQSQMFARIIVGIVNKKIPKFTSLERMISGRKGKMYLDFLQNRPGATIAGPYSLRPKPGATVSMPLEWKEVKAGLKMADFTIFNAIDRLKTKGKWVTVYLLFLKKLHRMHARQ